MSVLILVKPDHFVELNKEFNSTACFSVESVLGSKAAYFNLITFIGSEAEQRVRKSMFNPKVFLINYKKYFFGFLSDIVT